MNFTGPYWWLVNIGLGNGLVPSGNKPLPVLMLTQLNVATWHICELTEIINSLWPSDTIWRHKSGSTLDQVMACCLTAPSHYLNQCWLIISKIQWHSSEYNFTRYTPSISHWNKLENYLSKILFKSPRVQWVKIKAHHETFMETKYGDSHQAYFLFSGGLVCQQLVSWIRISNYILQWFPTQVHSLIYLSGW